MPFHTIQRGECLSSIAKRYGFANWRTIFDHPQNEELRKKRPNPNTLARGDVLFIPDKEEKQEPAKTDEQHDFTRDAQNTRLRVVLKDHERKPLAGKKYKLTIGGASVEGTTGDDGLLEQPIPHDAMKAELMVTFDEKTQAVWTLNLGGLDPIDKDTGVHSRLCNLGHPCEQNAMEPALRDFQTREGIEVTGRADDATRARLVDRHDKLG